MTMGPAVCQAGELAVPVFVPNHRAVAPLQGLRESTDKELCADNGLIGTVDRRSVYLVLGEMSTRCGTGLAFGRPEAGIGNPRYSTGLGEGLVSVRGRLWKYSLSTWAAN